MIASAPASPVRILLDYRPALRERTGVGEYVHELARALVESAPAAESLTLFSSSRKDRLSASAVPGALTVDRTVPVRLLNFAWHRLGWPPVERLAGGPFDVVHSTHPLLIPARDAARLVTIYDLDFLDHPERTRAEIRRDYPALAADHARRADHIIVISRHTAEQVRERFGVAADRISICYPGAPAWPRRDREPANGCVLFLGTLSPRKNLGTLLDAYEQLVARRPTAPPLVLAGGFGADADRLLERTRRAPLAGRVETPGYVPVEQRLDLYRRALVFVMPSFAEGFGMPVVEAMTCGVPVIAANRGALPEAVGQAGRLVDPEDARGLSAAIEALVADAAERQRLADAGVAQAGRFTWRAAAQGVREGWAAAIERRSPRRG
ncbi:MAG TPA: glycosyltransferase family 1 protein [Vicinamibacterales bacterium]|nr:glycosyltransferase family 1 protein [Vicinamibacterales bacterium]